MNVVDGSKAGALAAIAVAAALVVASVEPAAADSCGASCRHAYNQCRIETKGSSACERAFTSCMQHCRSRNR